MLIHVHLEKGNLELSLMPPCRYLHWVKCPNELPPTLSAYKTQQYRWNSGPMTVIKQLIACIWSTKLVTWRDRISCTYFFFR
jgi:beta-mannan synthase